MAQIDFGLLNRDAPQQVGASFDQGRHNALAMQLAQQQQEQNALSMGKMRQDDENRNALRNISMQSGGDPQKIIQGMYQQGMPAEAMAMQGHASQQQNSEVARAMALLKLMGESSYQVFQRPEASFAVQKLTEFGRVSGQDMSGEIQKVQMMNPDQIQQWAKGGMTSAQEHAQKFQLANVGDGYQAIQYGPGGAKLVGDKIPVADKASKSPDPYFTPIYTNNGVGAFDNRKGTATPVTLDGQPTIRATDDPTLQGKISGAKEYGKTVGEADAKSMLSLADAVPRAEQTVKLVDNLIKHPGREMATGASRYLRFQDVKGTDAKGFEVALEQIKGKQFLEAFESLKGGGQITEMEGAKATAALSRMNADVSDAEFVEAAAEFTDIIKRGLEKAKAKAVNAQQRQQGNTAQPGKGPSQQPGPIKFLGFE